MQCYVCGTENRDDAVRCKRCKANLHDNTVDCPACGQTSEVDGVHCTNCGYDLSQPRINPEERLKSIVSMGKYFLAFVMALLTFFFTFGKIVEIDLVVTSNEPDTIITQDAFNLYQGTSDILFRSDAFIENRLEGRQIIYGQVNTYQELAEMYSTLNLLSYEYVGRSGSQPIILGIAVLQSVVLIAMQLLPLIVLALALIAYIKRRPMHIVKYGFLAMGLAGILFSRLQIKMFYAQTNLSSGMVAYIAISLVTFVLLVTIEKIEISENPEDFFSSLKAKPISIRLASIAVGFIALIFLSGAFIRTTIEVSGEGSHYALIGTDAINLSPEYLTGDASGVDADTFELSMHILLNGSNSDLIARQVRNLPFERLFGADVDTIISPRLMIVMTFLSSMMIGGVVILNLFVQTIEHRFFKNTLAKGLSIIQGLLLLVMVALAIMWSLGFNNYLDTSSNTISTFIGPCLMIATVLTIIQIVLVFIYNKEPRNADEVFVD